MEYRTVKEIAETLRNAKDRNKCCSLLIGAGCSVKAGIPAAAGFVDIIKERYPLTFDRALEKTYLKCMAELSSSDRRDLIAEYVDKAKINWAHVCIALLMREGYVDRVLTTNFDPLVMKACALLGEFPAVYDLAASQLFKAADIPGKAIIYLHGQRTGFVLMNTEEDVKNHSEALGPVFADAGQGRIWIVAGYSGENDPVFEHLAGVSCFYNGLFWVGYEDNEPRRHIRDGLPEAKKDAFFTKGYDADSFFVTLTQELGIFPPDFITRPFTYLDGIFEKLTPWDLPKQITEQDIPKTTRQLIHKAMEKYEAEVLEKIPAEGANDDDISQLELATQKHLMAGKYDKAIALRDRLEGTPSAEFSESLSWAYILQGNVLYKQAETKTGEEADNLFALAGEKYRQAIKIKPDNHEALNNWGAAFSEQAKTKTGDEADSLFALAGEKYRQVLEIKPDKPEALYNWGNALSEQAKTKTGDEADSLFAQGGEKYRQALEIKPDNHEALNNLGNAFLEQAKTKTGDEADQLFALAGEKYRQALEIKPDKHEALNNLGNVFLEQAKTKTGEEADNLFSLAGEKYRQAIEIKPDMHDALNNWGTSLSDQAKTKTGEEANNLFALAGGKYQQVIEIKPDMHTAMDNWGYTLVEQAKTKTGEEADNLFALAEEKLYDAEKIQPGAGSYNLACICALQNKEDECRKWLETSQQFGKLPSREHLLKDTDLESVRECEWFKALLPKS